MNETTSAVGDFYAGRDVLVTGATGFLGKIVVEKLLYSAPNIRSIFLLIRPQNGLTSKQRLESMIKSNIFERVQCTYPDRLQKLVAVSGNLMEEDLGLSSSSVSQLTDSVSVVIHCAATVKFDEALRISVQMNVAGTQRLVALCHKMQSLVALVHASTAYANCDRSSILETVYSPPVQPQKLMEAFEWMNDDMVDALTPALVGSRPNTYTLTKSLAEYLLMEESGSLPLIIIRPSIIGAAWEEPFKGWVDNLNGPTGLFIAVGKGLLHNMSGNVNARADLIPVDVVANLLIVAGWYRAVQKISDIPVVNCCSGNLNPLHWHRILGSFQHFYERPMDGIYRVPSWHFTTNRTYRNAMVLMNHVLPAYVADAACRCAGKRPRLVRLYTKLFKAVDSLEYFTSKEWDFQSKNLPLIWENMSPSDRKIFNFDIRQVNWDRYLLNYLEGCKKYMLKEEPDQHIQAKKHYNRVLMCSTVVQWSSMAIAVRLLVKYSSVFRSLYYAILRLLLRLYQIAKYPMSILPK